MMKLLNNKALLILLKSIFIFAIATDYLESQIVDRQPNVILILADDMGVGDISAFNEGRSMTPEIDKLIDNSVYFNQAYAGSPVCAPSRAALLTGRYPHRTGSVTLNQRNFPDLTRIHLDETIISEIFKANGYITGLIGKWHSGIGEEYHPLSRGFDEYAGFNIGLDIRSYFDYQLDIQGTYQSFTDEYLTDEFTKRAIDFVSRHRDEPFFLHLSHYAPHRPLSAPQEKIDKYVERGFNEDIATVYAMIEIMDRGIGELMDKLDELNIQENTIVIFTSDNGPDPFVGNRFNINSRGSKYYIYEGGIHVPFLMNWEGKFSPVKRDEIIHFTDVFPTLIEICNLELPISLNKLDGVSIAGLLFDEKERTELPEYRYWQWNRGVPYYSHNAAIREGNWKLVHPYVTRNIPDKESDLKPKLFNLEKDPEEQIDFSEQYPQIYDRLRVYLRQWTREVEFERLNK